MKNQELGRLLENKIVKDGPLSIAEFMDAVSRTYYASGDKFGRDGDFITAPEISQVFGELVGLWCVTAWRALGQPSYFNIVECGPGRGTLMADALRAIAGVASPFIEAMSIHLVETSPSLRKLQEKTLSSYQVEWHEDLSTLPKGPLILVGNEFLDALPIQQFEKTPHGWCERLIDYKSKNFVFVTSSKPISVIDSIFDDAPTGSILEQSEAVQNFAKSITRLCIDQHGIALLIDYGHTHTDIGDTLQAIRRHKYKSVLAQPGEADVTAHVDFAAVKEAIRSEGALMHGPIEQGLWLRRLGIDVREKQLSKGKTSIESAAIQSGIQRLTQSDSMGTLFKVIAVSPPEVSPLAGFEIGS